MEQPGLQQQQRGGEEDLLAASSTKSCSRGGAGPDCAAVMELDHAMGFLSIPDAAHLLPGGDGYITAVGGSVLLESFSDPHNQCSLRGHDQDISCLAMEPSGRLAAAGQGGENADVTVWNLKTKQLLYRLCEHDIRVVCVSFSHDGKLLCSVGCADDNKLVIWDMSTGAIVTASRLAPMPIECIAWGGMVLDIKGRPTRHYQLATSGAKKVMLWSIDPYTGEMKSERVVQEGRGCTQRDITSMMFSPDGASMFCGTTSGDFMIASVRAKTLGAAVAACSAGARCVLALDSGGVAVGGGDGTVTIFDRSMRDIAQVELTGRVMGLSKSADGQELLASTDAGHIYRIEAKSMGAALVAESHRSPVRTVSYSRHTSDLFATAAADGTINVWDAGSYRAIASAVVKDAGEPLCLVFTADMLLTGWDDGRLRSHDWETGRLLWQIDSAHLDGVTALAVSHNERYLLTGGEHGELRIWELRSREMVAHLKQHRQRVGSVVLFGDDIHALSVSRDRCLICWDLRAERQVSAHSQRMGGINAVALVHDESRVLTVGQEKRFTMWNLADPSPTLMGDLSPDMDDEAKALTVSHCGRFFATAGTGRTVKLWDVSTGSLVSEGLGHSGSISALQFSPDDKQLVSVGNDGIIIWNLYA